MVEEFIAEAHAHNVPVYHKIRQIDSIALESLRYPITGLHRRIGDRHEILLHEAYTGRRIQKTTYHEIGHVLGLEHSNEIHTIMYPGSYSVWFENEENWKKAKDQFFNSLKP